MRIHATETRYRDCPPAPDAPRSPGIDFFLRGADRARRQSYVPASHSGAECCAANYLLVARNRVAGNLFIQCLCSLAGRSRTRNTRLRFRQSCSRSRSCCLAACSGVPSASAGFDAGESAGHPRDRFPTFRRLWWFLSLYTSRTMQCLSMQRCSAALSVARSQRSSFRDR
jgi:hypothetical protein